MWYILQHKACVGRSVADIVHSPNNSSVVSEIGLPKGVLHPPNKTTTLKFAPLPNATAE